ncbi:hypothetical protein AAY47_07850 [Xenorhabdus griffiniae]|nr:hypothetical protein AAY47_07850 [Xenorhabdus griffiniae]
MIIKAEYLHPHKVILNNAYLIITHLYQSNFKMRVIFPRAAGKYKASRRLADCNLKFIEYKQNPEKNFHVIKL